VQPALPNSTHYAATGRVADALARLAAVHAERERPWARVQERLEIEDWTVSGREGVS
jgi:chromosome partition protein MukF